MTKAQAKDMSVVTSAFDVEERREITFFLNIVTISTDNLSKKMVGDHHQNREHIMDCIREDHIHESAGKVLQEKRNKSILLRPPRIVSRDGRYVAYDNGIVCDCYTSTEWYAGPNEDSSWFEAKRWVRNLSVGGGNWSLPSLDQLRGLYRKKKNGDLLTPLLAIQCTDVWSAECPDGASALGFNFIPGNTFKTFRSYSSRFRVLATRPKPVYKNFQLPTDVREQCDNLEIDCQHKYETLSGGR